MLSSENSREADETLPLRRSPPLSHRAQGLYITLHYTPCAVPDAVRVITLCKLAADVPSTPNAEVPLKIAEAYRSERHDNFVGVTVALTPCP
jgi:hypothetical protein